MNYELVIIISLGYLVIGGHLSCEFIVIETVIEAATVRREGLQIEFQPEFFTFMAVFGLSFPAVQVEIDHSKAILKSSELRVTTAKNELMKYLDNKKRILISGKTYFTLLHHLIHKYEATIEEAAKAHANHQVEKEKQQIAQQTIKREIAQLEQDKQSLTQQLAQLEAEHVQILGALRAQREEDHQKQKQQKQLEQIL